MVDAGAVPLLVLCIQEPEIALKRIAASSISDLAKHSPELAQTVVDAGAIAHLAQMILNPDAKLKVNKLVFLVLFCFVYVTNYSISKQRQVFSALSQIAKHSVDLAEMVVEAEIFPASFACLKDSDEYVKKNCATLIREVAKHTPEVGFFLFEDIFSLSQFFFVEKVSISKFILKVYSKWMINSLKLDGELLCLLRNSISAEI